MSPPRGALPEELTAAASAASSSRAAGAGSVPASAAALRTPILLDLSLDRLMELSKLTDSVLLKSQVFPMVRYFLARGQVCFCSATGEGHHPI